MKLAICTTENSYSAALAKRLELLCPGLKPVVYPITQPGCFDSDDYDLILSDTGESSDFSIKLKAKDPVSIPKYQPVGRLASQVSALAFGARPPAQQFNLSDVRLVGITAIGGGCGVSATAVCLGQILSRIYHKKTLYMSMEYICRNLTDYLIPADSFRSFLAKLSENPDNPPEFIIDEFGLSHFACLGINPLSAMSAEKVFSLILKIAPDFEYLILDLPLCNENMRLLSQCDYKIEVKTPIAGKQTTYPAILSGTLPFSPARDEFSFRNTEEGRAADIHGQFGSEVRNLAKLLFFS